MKKLIPLFLTIVIALIIVSCAGPKGATGPAGASGTIFMKEFQYGSAPNASYTNAVDTFIYSGQSTYNYGGCSYVTIGTTGISQVFRGLFRFDISAITPANIKVDSAYLTLFVAGGSAYPITMTAYALEGSWNEGAGPCSGAAVSGQSWGFFINPGGDFNQLVPLSLNSVARNFTAPDYYSPAVFSLDTAVVQSWIAAPYYNFGLIVKSSDETADSDMMFYTKESTGSPLYNPKLTVYYELP